MRTEKKEGMTEKKKAREQNAKVRRGVQAAEESAVHLKYCALVRVRGEARPPH